MGYTFLTKERMVPLSTVIVDDEQLARDELAFLLKNIDDVNVVAQGKNGLEAVNLIREHNPDLVFLDVQMPGLDGFGVIKKLLDKKLPLPKIVFSTAFDQYAVKAFEVNAVDYLLKPFDEKRVAQSVQKARATMETEESSSDKLETLVRMLESQKPQALQDSAEIRWAADSGQPARHLLRLDRGWHHHCRDRRAQWDGRPVELPHAGRIARQPRSEFVLARPPLFSGECQSHQRSRPLVQELLPASHGRQEANRDSGQPGADQAPAGIVRVVKKAAARRETAAIYP